MRTVGIDEVGRGCWAGPVVAGAVLLPDDFVVPADAGWRLADSKQLSPAARERADAGVREVAVALGLGWVPAEEVDEAGLSEAVRLAMRRALAEAGLLPGDIDAVVIDGSFNFLADWPQARAVVKADASLPAVSAASIVAKVARDRWMAEAGRRYPQYGFESHAGYGTARHRQALGTFGPCRLHRRSFKPVRQLAAADGQ